MLIRQNDTISNLNHTITELRHQITRTSSLPSKNPNLAECSLRPSVISDMPKDDMRMSRTWHASEQSISHNRLLGIMDVCGRSIEGVTSHNIVNYLFFKPVLKRNLDQISHSEPLKPQCDIFCLFGILF